jgi:hypothetical protein
MSTPDIIKSRLNNFLGDGRPPKLPPGDGGGGDMEALTKRVDKLDEHVTALRVDVSAIKQRLDSELPTIKSDIGDLKKDFKDLRGKVDTHFLILGGMIISTALGLAYLLAKGFHWL